MHDNSRFPQSRKHDIRQRLLAGQEVRANDLAREFAISEDAIRRDLRALAAEGICERVYGGALPLSPAAGPALARLDDDQDGKAALAQVALTAIAGGRTLFLDASTTNLALAQVLPDDPALHVVTNAVLIAAALLHKPQIHVSLIGGRIDPAIGGAVDGRAMAALDDYVIDLAVVGACGFDLDAGLSVFDADDAAFKRALLRRARKSMALLTQVKIGTCAPYRICEISAVSTYVLPAAPARALTSALQKAGCQVLTTP